MITIRTGKLLFVEVGHWFGDASEVGLRAGSLPEQFTTDNPDEYGTTPFKRTAHGPDRAEYIAGTTRVTIWNV